MTRKSELYFQHESFLDILLKDQMFFDRIFHDTKSFKQFREKMNKEIKECSSIYASSGKSILEFVGDVFEIFAEAFFKSLHSDNRVGIYQFLPEKKALDNGVDGYGLGIDGLPATVQVKFRSNSSEQLVERDLKQFVAQSIIKYDVNKDTNTNMIVFTNAAGIHWHTKGDVFCERIRAISGNQIQQLIDNNSGFWYSVNQILELSKIQYFGNSNMEKK